MKGTSNYYRIGSLGRVSALRTAGARPSAMMDFSRAMQVWAWMEQRCAHHGYDIFVAWQRERDVMVLSHEMRGQLLWLSTRMGGTALMQTRLMAQAQADAQTLEQKGMAYGDSWKKRGGVGAFMMLARKWDRIENIIGSACGHSLEQMLLSNPGNVKDDFDDLRCYLLLVEDEMMNRVPCMHHDESDGEKMVCTICGMLRGASSDGEAGKGYVNQD